MGIYETFSKRKKKRECAGKKDVYIYDDLPQTLRVQVAHIWNSALGRYVDMSHSYTSQEGPASNALWRIIFKTITRELGVFNLGTREDDPFDQCHHHLLNADTDEVLDIIELSFRVIDGSARRLGHYAKEQSGITQDPDDAIGELNYRFKENGIGYQFVTGQIIRVDSEYVHAEVIKPALALLNDVAFNGASDEFLRAHKHFREGNNKEAIAEALKAFESTMKAICDVRKWRYANNATAKPLIDILVSNGLIPSELTSHFQALRSAMESGLPTIRNRMGGHGQGKDPVRVPAHFSVYALHLAAANIVFLVEAHKAKR